MKCSLGISSFLEEISSLSHFTVFLYFFALFTYEGFRVSLTILWNSAFRWVCHSFSPLPFTSLLFSVIFKASSDNHYAFFGRWSWSLPPVQCHEPLSIILQASCLSDLRPWIYFSLSLYNHKGYIWFRSYLNGLVIFPYFLQFKSEFGNKDHDLSHHQLPVLFLLTVKSSSIFGCKEYSQYDFCIDSLMMSICRVFSCVAERGCLLWPVLSLGKALLAFDLLCFVLQGQICLLLKVSPDFLLLNFNPL